MSRPSGKRELDADLEAEVDDALDERLDAAAVGLGEDLDVVGAQEGVAEAVDGADERHHELVARALVELVRRAGLLDPAFVHHDDLLGDLHRLLLIVGDEDRRHVDFLVQPAQPLAQLAPDLRVERAERLVQQQHPRLHRQRPGQRHPLELAAGELRGVALGEAVEPDESQQLLHARADLRLRALAHGQPEGDVVVHGHVLEGGVVLEDEAHAAVARGRVGDVLARRSPRCRCRGSPSPAMIRSSVDLPLPLGPSSAVSEPSSTRMQTSSSATKSPKRLLTLTDLDRHRSDGRPAAGASREQVHQLRA